MKIRKVTTNHLVKGEDLNHHGTLFAGRAAEWFVESGFLAAAAWVPTENIVLVKINSMTFSRPVKRGAVLRLDSEVVRAGRTSLEAHIEGSAGGVISLEGSITFVNVDTEGKPMAHGIVIGS